MKSKISNKVFIYAFLFLYLLVAAISFFHAIEFFSIGNVEWMSVTLAFAFELGLAVCLCSILLGNNKDNTVAWILLTILVIVQVCGNTYSVFKFIATSEEEYYQYLAKPLLFWVQEVSEETVQIIVAWIMGAILPIVALLMTEMVSRSIKMNREEKSLDDDHVNPQQNLQSNPPVDLRPTSAEPVKLKQDEPIKEEISSSDKPIVDATSEPSEPQPQRTDKREAVKPVFPLKEPIVVTGDVGNLKAGFER